MILVVDSSLAIARTIAPTNFYEEGVWERRHIQEWVRKHPQLLGEDLLILSLEFDRFTHSEERIDALAVDRAGNLVVIEFKRGSDGGSAELQAVRYAAMIASTRLAQIAPYFVAYLSKYEQRQVELAEAILEIQSFVHASDFTELSSRPRIILCSQDFGPELTTTVLWLREFGLDLSCVRITPHKIDNNLVIVPTKIIPLPEAESYTIGIREKEEAIREEKKERKERTFPYLLKMGVIKEGDVLYFSAHLPDYIKYDANDSRFKATVTGSKRTQEALKWEHDQKSYASSALAWQILSESHPTGNPGGTNGSWYWANSEGKCLWELDEATRSNPEPGT